MPSPNSEEVEPVLAQTLARCLAYLEGLDGAPARAVGLEEAAETWDPALPGAGLGAAAAIEELAELALAASLASSGPRYHHYVVGGVTPAALGAAWLASSLDQVASSWESSPAAARIEEVALRWLGELLALPAEWTGVLVSGAHQGNQACLAAARQWWGQEHGVDVARDGLGGLPAMPVLGGGYVHASIPKALAGLGLGSRSVKRLAKGGRGAFDLERLRAELGALGGRPCVVIVSAGEVNSGGFDPLGAIVELCRDLPVWIHVDGAFGLCTRALPECLPWTAGLESVQSAALDAHKWLNVPTGCGVAYVADKRQLAAPHRLRGGYLPAGSVPRTVFANLSPEMSRPARAFALWACLAAYGQGGVQDWIRRHLRLAAFLGRELSRHPDLELLAPVASNVVCFRARPRGLPGRELDRLNETLIAELRADGRWELGSTRFAGCTALRVAFANWRTQESHVKGLLAVLTAWAEQRSS